MRYFTSILATAVVALLLLSGVVSSATVSESSYRLRETGHGWKPCDPTARQYSGYFDANATSQDPKHYFYWAAEPRKVPAKNAPIVVWLSGGPGCSSGLALLSENGPCQMDADSGKLRANPYSWSNENVAIWVDQPTGVGYSYGGHMSSNEEQVGEDMDAFIQHLLRAHPEWQDNELTVSAESYGGKYAPNVAYTIYKNNLKGGADRIKVKLVGVTIGNGLVRPTVQYPQYEPFVCGPNSRCAEVRGKPCVGAFSCDLMNASLPSCVKACKECDAGNALACALGRESCNGQMEAYMMSGLNPYNIKLECKVRPLCYNFTAVTNFFNRADVKASLGADPGVTWQSCNMEVNMDFGNDWLLRADLKLIPLLESGVRVLAYNGDLDFICNYYGGNAWTHDLDWSGQSAFNAAPYREWRQGSTTRGWVRSLKTSSSPIAFSFMRVANAGHLVPHDQPMTAYEMINAFVKNQDFIQ